MTRDEVIRALELCRYDPDPGQKLKSLVSCYICPYWEDKQGCRLTDMFNDAIALLKQEPVRCEKCRWGCWTKNMLGEDMIQCANSESPVSETFRLVAPDWFCADGERKEEEDENHA